jgi:hypothetical protein
MTLQELARQTGTRFVLPGRRQGAEIARVIAGDRMSDLLERAGPDALLVTPLANPHLFRMAELMDVPGICLVRQPEVGLGLLEAASSCGAALLLAGGELEETRELLERCLGSGQSEPRP